MDDDGVHAHPDEEEPLIQTRPRTERIRYAVGAAGLIAAATRPALWRETTTTTKALLAQPVPAAFARDLDPSLCAEADAEQCAHLCTEYECKALSSTPATRAGAVCALAAFANLDTVCAAMGYCAGEVVDDVQAWFGAGRGRYLESDFDDQGGLRTPVAGLGVGRRRHGHDADVVRVVPPVCAGADCVARTCGHRNDGDATYGSPTARRGTRACRRTHTGHNMV